MPRAPPSSALISEIPAAAPARSGGAVLTIRSDVPTHCRSGMPEFDTGHPKARVTHWGGLFTLRVNAAASFCESFWSGPQPGVSRRFQPSNRDASKSERSTKPQIETGGKGGHQRLLAAACTRESDSRCSVWFGELAKGFVKLLHVERTAAVPVPLAETFAEQEH
jgi:hypothetical protein